MRGKSIAPLLLRRLKGMEQWRNRAPIAFPNLPAIAPVQGGAIVRNCAQCQSERAAKIGAGLGNDTPTMARNGTVSHCGGGSS